MSSEPALDIDCRPRARLILGFFIVGDSCDARFAHMPSTSVDWVASPPASPCWRSVGLLVESSVGKVAMALSCAIVPVWPAPTSAKAVPPLSSMAGFSNLAAFSFFSSLFARMLRATTTATASTATTTSTPMTVTVVVPESSPVSLSVPEFAPTPAPRSPLAFTAAGVLARAAFLSVVAGAVVAGAVAATVVPSVVAAPMVTVTPTDAGATAVPPAAVVAPAGAYAVVAVAVATTITGVPAGAVLVGVVLAGAALAGAVLAGAVLAGVVGGMVVGVVGAAVVCLRQTPGVAGVPPERYSSAPHVACGVQC